MRTSGSGRPSLVEFAVDFRAHDDIAMVFNVDYPDHDRPDIHARSGTLLSNLN